MITGHGSVEGAVRAMRRGAIDYLEKPFEFDALLLTVENSLETTALRREVRRLRREASEAGGASELIGRTPQMQELNTVIDRVAQSDPATVLLQGESGTGKNVVARAIHQRSVRAEKPFVTIACTSLPENLLESELMGHERGAFTDAHSTKRGLLEVADGGTVFLDEIGELPPSLQAKLLHLLEERSFRRIGGTRTIKVDVRILAATNRDLRAAVERGQFRNDFYYRLNIVPIWIPALRERKADIPLLVDTFVTLFNREFRKEVRRGDAGRAAGPHAPPLAGQRPRAEEPGGARHDPGRRAARSAWKTCPLNFVVDRHLRPKLRADSRSPTAASTWRSSSAASSCRRWSARAATGRRPAGSSVSTGTR